MPSSGTSSYTVTRDELIHSSFRLIRVIKETDVPNRTQYKWGSMALNMLLKNMQSNGLQLWTYQLIEIPMQVGKLTYTIGPVGADVIITRPLRLFEGSFIRNTACTPYIDTPLRLISRLEYLQYGNKSVQALPNSVYYQPWIDDASGTTSPSTGYGTLFVYTTSSLTTQSVFCNFQRPIYDVTNGTEEFDLPQEWFRALRFILASDLSYEYPTDPQIAKDVRDKAKTLHDDLQDWSTETAAVTFQPDSMSYRQR